MSKPKDKTELNPVASRFKLPFAKGVSTRKFFGKVKVESEQQKPMRSNADFIVASAAGMKVLSATVDKIAQNARESLQKLNELVTESVNSDTGDGKRGSKGTTYNESDMDAIQESFARDSIKLHDDEIDQSVKILIESATRNVLKGGTIGTSIRNKPRISSRINSATPEIDYIRLLLDNRGLIDKFSAEIKFTISEKQINESSVKAVRIFRAKKSIPETTRNARVRLSRVAMDTLSSNPNRTRDKNFAKFGSFQQKNLEAKGIENALSDTTKIDNITGLRHGLVSSSGSIKSFSLRDQRTKSSDDKNLLMLQSFLDISKPINLDTSVVNDLKSIRNIQLQNSTLNKSVVSTNINEFGTVNRDSTDRLKSVQVRNIRNSNKLKDDFITSKTNSSNYKELTIIPLSRLKSKNIGNLIEFVYVDSTVELGESYSYYISSIDDHIAESSRSRIVKINIEHVIPPKEPKHVISKFEINAVTLSIVAHKEDHIEKFEIFRKDLNSNKISRSSKKIEVINGKNGFITEIEDRDAIGNGFVQVGEVLNLLTAGASFRDKGVVGARKYMYRIYSVDIYGNKSQNPKEVIVFTNERGMRARDLEKPTVIAEIDSKTKNIKLTITGNDNRLIGYFIGRKNLTIHDTAFVIPTQPSHTRLGNCQPHGCNRFKDTILVSTDNAWNGFVHNTSEHIIFIDKTTRIDNTYQYSVYGVDRFGNKTSYEITNPLFISRRPMVSEPINMSAKISKEGHVKIMWADGNLDIDPRDRIGNRDVLDATSFRTLFQVERKKIGDDKWYQFPLTEKPEIDDSSPRFGEQAPQYRPDLLEVDSDYLYRVAAFQTGGFVSNFSEPLRISTALKVLQPTNFKINACDSKCEPFFTTLNWDTPSESGTVDQWIIEKAEVNNFAAAKLNVTNIEEIKKLNFKEIIRVHRESSRSRSRIDDSRDKEIVNISSTKNNILTGQHHFIDNDVKFGNTYFYRLTAVGLSSQNRSQPLIKGIKIIDQTFEKKLNVSITQREKNSLARDKKPLVLRSTLLRTHGSR